MTTAITISHLEAWEEGLAPKELEEFFERHAVPQNGSASTDSRNYAQALYRVFWRKYSHPIEIYRRVLRAAADATSLGSLNWAGCDLNLPIDEVGRILGAQRDKKSMGQAYPRDKAIHPQGVHIQDLGVQCYNHLPWGLLHIL